MASVFPTGAGGGRRTELVLAPERVPDDECCLKCRFWKSDGPDDSTGRCRRKSPRMLQDDDDGSWPITFYSEWCGEFEPGRWLVTWPAGGVSTGGEG